MKHEELDPALRAKIEKKIDEFGADSFPASDTPQWSSLEDFVRFEEEEKLKREKKPTNPT